MANHFSNDADVLIIGAGIAGLAAAEKLQRDGINSIVLEARNRIGGRIWTTRDLDCPVDLGAALIHRHVRNPITALAKKVNSACHTTNYRNAAYFDRTGKSVDRRFVAEQFENFDRILGNTKKRWGCRKKDISIADGLEDFTKSVTFSPVERAIFKRAEYDKVLDTAEEFSRISLNAWDEDGEFSGPDALLPCGYDKIFKGLVRSLDIRLGERVRVIRHARNRVVLETQRRKFRGKLVLVTLPLGILKGGTISFVPGLPNRKVKAIQRLGVGELNKIVLQFKNRFWSAKPEYFSCIDPQGGMCGEFLNQYAYTKAPILVGLWGGDAARSVLKRPDSRVLSSVMRQLSQVFGRRIPMPSRILITRWGNDPFAAGAYSFVPVGTGCSEMDVLAEPVNGTLFFAGEATNRIYPNTVHGAFLSGIRESKKIKVFL